MASGITFNEKTSAIDVGKHYASRGAGKTVLITGATLGSIGDATARGFAVAGAATIIITGRDDSRNSAAVKELSATYPKTQFRAFTFDLSSLAATKQGAQKILDDTSIPVIDILVANAGMSLFVHERQVTGDGLEIHFAVNHLAHFIVINTLLPKLRAAAKKNAPGETRVVPLSSKAYISSPIRFSDWQYLKKDLPADEQPNRQFLKFMEDTVDPDNYNHNVAYGQSKTANILTALHINTLFAKEGIYGFAVHPGFVDSNGVKKMLETVVFSQGLQAMIGEPKTIDQGASTTLVAALDPKLTPEQFYLEDAHAAVEEMAPHAKDPKAAERLWKLSEDIIKEQLGN